MIFYKHLRLGKFAVTLAYRFIDGGIEYGAAYCSKKDQFCKEIGREIALNRLMNSLQAGFVTMPTEDNPITKILLDIVYNCLYPPSMRLKVLTLLAMELHKEVYFYC